MKDADPIISTEQTISLGLIDLTFGGNSMWSDVNEPRNLTFELVAHKWEDDDCCVVSLNANFEPEDWDVFKDGLIYTDSNWIKQLNTQLVHRGYPEASYSEQGMQGRTYVNLDWSDSDKLERKIRRDASL